MERSWLPVSILLLVGCASSGSIVPPDRATLRPLEVADAAFIARGPRFAPGLYATVRLCANPQGRIVSADVVVSSGEKRFDDFVVDYARRVQVLKPQQLGGKSVSGCNTVRVEINRITNPGMSAGEQSALG
jgi:hypothetical protein